MTLKSHIYIACTLLLYLTSMAAHSFSLRLIDSSPLCAKPPEYTNCFAVLVDGEIEPGDGKWFAETLYEKQKAFNVESKNPNLTGPDDPSKKQLFAYIGEVVFDSAGGSLPDAIEMGRYIRKQQMATYVPRNWSCLSSCVIAFVGGVLRNPMGIIGVHSFYSKEYLQSEKFEELDSLYNLTAQQIEAYLKEMRISTRLLDIMMSTPHTRMHTWNIGKDFDIGKYNEKDSEELTDLLIFAGDPVYLQTRKK